MPRTSVSIKSLLRHIKLMMFPCIHWCFFFCCPFSPKVAWFQTMSTQKLACCHILIEKFLLSLSALRSICIRAIFLREALILRPGIPFSPTDLLRRLQSSRKLLRTSFGRDANGNAVWEIQGDGSQTPDGSRGEAVSR